MNPKVDFYFNKGAWQEETAQLRKIILSCELTEALKWGCPCYTHDTKNIVLIHVFKEYCALLFFKGSLLKDPAKVLIQQTEHVQAARQMRFTNVKEIVAQTRTIKNYVYEAIEVERAGLKVALKKTKEFPMPAEFKKKLASTPKLKAAFAALTPGRQRGYLLFFSSAKQAVTREARIEKSIADIIKGKGLND